MGDADVPALEVRDLRYAYKKRPALDGLTFAVRRRSIHGFVGPNGAGKTTTLKIAATLLRPGTGMVKLFGLDSVREYKRVRRAIGFMPDHFSMYRQMTVFEYLDFFAAAYGFALENRNRVIQDVLTLTDMELRKDELLKSLSRGMQQRVGLARVLVHDPELLLLDEPASGLDPRARMELMDILQELRRMGKTIFISSHILAELSELCDSLTIIDRGRVKFTGPKDDLLRGARDAWRYVLSLRAPHEGLEGVLKAMDGMAEVVPTEETPGFRLKFARAVSPNQVLAAVIGSGAEIGSFREDLQDLGEAFLNLTEPGISL